MVGCVIVLDQEIISEGYHQKYGEGHAEVNAISGLDDTSILPECTVYVNLEPCAHHGKTPPCAKLLAELGVKKVVIGATDPHSKVAGKGIQILKEAGCEVITGVLEKQCEEVNKRFFTFHQQKRPFVILKWAETADGFIDADRQADDAALKITGQESAIWTHQLRSTEAGILIGTETALKDDPALTVRHVNGNNPLRIIVDREERLSRKLKVYSDTHPTLTLTIGKSHQIGNKEWLTVEDWRLENILETLFQRNLLSVMVEGGAAIHNSFVSQQLWDEAYKLVNPELQIHTGIKAPEMNNSPVEEQQLGADRLFHYIRS